MRLFFTLYIVFIAVSCNQSPRQTTGQLDTATGNNLVVNRILQSISENPDSVKLYEKIIDTLTNSGRFVEAAAWCNKLIKRGADSNYYYWFIKGDIFRRGQLYDSAIASYQTYLRKFPDDEQVFLNLANTYAEAGNKDAVDLANKIAARFPTREMRSQAAFIKGVYYNTIKQYNEARRWLDTAIVINYNFSEAYMEKGYSLYDEHHFKEAEKTFSRITELNRNDADAWYWVAKSQEASGKKTEALHSYEQAYDLNNGITEARQAIDRLKDTNAKP
jgi:tetratricopeptide (TPR) repeat protein